MLDTDPLSAARAFMRGVNVLSVGLQRIREWCVSDIYAALLAR